MAKTTKSDTPVEAVVVEPLTSSERRPKSRIRSNSIFWGFAVIFIGVLLLLDNLQLITVHFGHLWQLWPILVIGAGVSLLSLRGWLGGLLSLVLALAFGVLAYLVAVENPFYDVDTGVSRQMTVVRTALIDGVDSLQLTLKTGAIDLTIKPGGGSDAYRASLVSNGLTLRQDETTVRDGIQFVTLATESRERWWAGTMNNSLSLSLTDRRPLSLNIETGASSVSGDLSTLSLQSLVLKTGASSIDLKLGVQQVRQDITVESGASSVTLRVPAAAGVRVETNSGLSSVDFEAVDKIADSVYESAGFSSAEEQITIRAKIGVSSLTIKRYK